MNKRFHYLRIALVLLTTIVFMTTGVLKLMSSPQETAMFLNWGYPLWLMYLTGVLNIILALGLVMKKTSLFAALGLIILLCASLVSNVSISAPPFVSLPAGILLCFLSCIIYLDVKTAKKPNN